MSKDKDLEWIEKSGGYEWTPGSPWPPQVPDEERCSGDDYQHSDYYYDYNRNDPDRENPFTEAFDYLMGESVTGKTPWIYESPDGGKTVFRRPFLDYNRENKEEIDWETKEPTGRKFSEYPFKQTKTEK